MNMFSLFLLLHFLILQEVLSCNISTSEDRSNFYQKNNLIEISQFYGSFGKIFNLSLQIAEDIQSGYIQSTLDLIAGCGPRLSTIYNVALAIIPETLRSTARIISFTIETTKELSINTHRAKSTSLLVTSTAILIGFRSLYDLVSSMDYNVTSFFNIVKETVDNLLKPNYMLDKSQRFNDVKIREYFKKPNVSSTRVFIY